MKRFLKIAILISFFALLVLPIYAQAECKTCGISQIRRQAPGGLWVVNQGSLESKTTPTPTPIPNSAAKLDSATAVLEQQGTSDELSDIETDLETTDLTNIDKELSDIESELFSP